MLFKLRRLKAAEGVWFARRATPFSSGSWFRIVDNCCCVITELSARNSSSCDLLVNRIRFKREERTHSFDGPQGPVGHRSAEFFVSHLNIVRTNLVGNSECMR